MANPIPIRTPGGTPLGTRPSRSPRASRPATSSQRSTTVGSSSTSTSRTRPRMLVLTPTGSGWALASSPGCTKAAGRELDGVIHDAYPAGGAA